MWRRCSTSSSLFTRTNLSEKFLEDISLSSSWSTWSSNNQNQQLQQLGCLSVILNRRINFDRTYHFLIDFFIFWTNPVLFDLWLNNRTTFPINLISCKSNDINLLFNENKIVFQLLQQQQQRLSFSQSSNPFWSTFFIHKIMMIIELITIDTAAMSCLQIKGLHS